MDLELPTHLTLGAAHTSSERLEQAIRAELGPSTVVVIHLEPRRDHVRPAVRYTPLDEQVRKVVSQIADATTITQIDTLLTDEGTIVTLRCAYPPSAPLSEVHTAMARLERDLRRAFPDVVRVQIDPEPGAAGLDAPLGQLAKASQPIEDGR